LLHEAACTVDEAGRYELFQQAEAILLDDLPIIPLYYYTRVYLLHPAVKNWHPTFLDHHPYKHVYLEPSSE
jgi:oligopeptide transport system substrate-binding protein